MRENKYTRRAVRKESLKLQKHYEELITYKTIEAGYAAAEMKQILKELGVRVSKGDASVFEKDISILDTLAVYKELAKRTTHPVEVEAVGHRTLIGKGILRMKPRELLILSLFFFIPTANAKWNEWSSPPGELSAYDTLSIGASLGAIAASGLAAIVPPAAPVLLPVASGLKLLSGSVKVAGTGHRSIDHYTGKHTMSSRDLGFTVAAGLLAAVPAAGEIPSFIKAANVPANAMTAIGMAGVGAEQVAATIPRTLGLTPSVARKVMGENISTRVKPAAAPNAGWEQFQNVVIQGERAVVKGAQSALELASANPHTAKEAIVAGAVNGLVDFAARSAGADPNAVKASAKASAKKQAKGVYNAFKSATGLSVHPENEKELFD